MELDIYAQRYRRNVRDALLFGEIQKESAERRASWQELLRRLGDVRPQPRASAAPPGGPAHATPDAPPNEAKKPQTGKARKKASRRKRSG